MSIVGAFSGIFSKKVSVFSETMKSKELFWRKSNNKYFKCRPNTDSRVEKKAGTKVGPDQLGSTRTNADRIKSKNKINLDSDQLGSIKKIKLN